ncbi:MAG: aspartate kinase [Eubacteriales bacterium]|nr:aspartate kinase [Eubacteriales bacterium]MDD3881567.1 aspartate kinase [Eubacteriales bacterium]MDD4513363.1 aspartate kinase [Eubacteriales bacterium]
MGVKVLKFGGSSLADAVQFQKVKNIITADESRRYVVPSAPGKRFSGDDKVTDLLYRAQSLVATDKDAFEETFDRIAARYMDITEELSLTIKITDYLDEVREALLAGADQHYAASRGEYLNGLLLADYLQYQFIDAKDYIIFNDNGNFDADATQTALSEKLAGVSRAVVPGFYGSIGSTGKVHTFSRGGSDITGALVARAVSADVYENWTDVSGFFMTDPKIVPDAVPIDEITYQELRELSYMGATVLHEDAVFPVHRAGIPTNIRNTNAPDDKGTWIRYSAKSKCTHQITGIAGHKGFSILTVEKAMMNSELGFGRRVLLAVEEMGLSFEHMPTGIDTMCVVLHTAELANCRQKLVDKIIEFTNPDTISIHDGMALIATVGRGMVHSLGTAAKLFTAMSENNINVKMIDQGSSEINIIVGVDEGDFERTVKAIYSAFVPAKA